MAERAYLAIDLKSFYASVECAARGLDPLKTNLVVADAARTEKTICLAVSPSLKAYGISVLQAKRRRCWYPVRPPYRRKIRWGEYSHLSGRSVLRKGHAPQIIMPCLSKTARPQISTVLSPASAEQAVFLFLQRYLTSLRPNPSGRRSRQLKIHNPFTVPARFRYNLLSH